MDGKLLIILLGFIYVHKYLYEIVTGAFFGGGSFTSGLVTIFVLFSCL